MPKQRGMQPTTRTKILKVKRLMKTGNYSESAACAAVNVAWTAWKKYRFLVIDEEDQEQPTTPTAESDGFMIRIIGSNLSTADKVRIIRQVEV